MKDSSKMMFMTGVTGFLGNFLLRDLLGQGRRIVAMLREPFNENKQCLHDRLQKLNVDLADFIDRGQLVLVRGALPDNLPELNGNRPNEILSCAASLQLFSNGNAEPFRTNVTGTLRLIDWARCHGIHQIHAVSTAYVCGSHTQCVREVFHHPKPDFQTEYERSKWIAESHLARWAEENGNTLTVYRPSFLIGDSSSGYTTQYGGFYQLARMVSLLKDEYGAEDDSSTYIPLRIPGRPDDPQNFVPIDFASRLIAEVIADEALHGRIYHLTDPTPPTNAHIKQFIEEYFQMHGGCFTDSEDVLETSSDAESLLWKQYSVLAPRITHNPRFEQSNTMQVMRAAGITFPTMNRDLFFTMLDRAIADRWGRGANGKQASRR